MYLPSHFAETRPEVLHALVRAQPLAVLVTHGAAGLEANHLPLLLDIGSTGETALLGHVARANPVWRLDGAVRAFLRREVPAMRAAVERERAESPLRKKG